MNDLPDLSPDSQFLLTNRAIDLSVLVEALVTEELPFLYHFFDALLDDSERSLVAAQETICRALADSEHYNGSLPVHSWLVSLGLQKLSKYATRQTLPEIRMLAQTQTGPHAVLFSGKPDDDYQTIVQIYSYLPLDQRAIALNMYLFEIPREESIRFKNIQEARAQEVLGEVEDKFLSTGMKKQQLIQVFQRLFPAPVMADDIIQVSINIILEKTRWLEMRRRLIVQVKSFAWVGLLLMLVGIIYWWNNQGQPQEQTDEVYLPPAAISALLPPPPTPTPLWVDNVFYGGMIVEPIPNIARRFAISEEQIRKINRIPETQDDLPDDGLYLPVPDIAYAASFPYVDQLLSQAGMTETRLDLDRLSPDQVYHSLATSNYKWTSLWLDIQYLDYTYWLPNNRAIPTRTQIWVVQPDRSLEITGFTPAKPQERNIILKKRHYFTLTESNTTIMTSFQPGERELVFDQLFREMIFPGEDTRFVRTGSFHNFYSGIEAGRQVIIADWFNDDLDLEYRLWIDEQMGVILRLQQFSPYTQELLNDRLVTDITYDMQISASFFDPRNPWQGGFALDETGITFPIERLQPTPTFALPAP